MSHQKTVIIVVLMALVMVFVSAPVSVADGPGSNDRSDVKTDGGDGHPWDDGTGDQNTDPPPDTGNPQVATSVLPGGGTLVVYAANSSLYSGWFSSSLYHLWKSIEAEVKWMRLAQIRHHKARRTR